jgi:hypothetical protein
VDQQHQESFLHVFFLLVNLYQEMFEDHHELNLKKKSKNFFSFSNYKKIQPSEIAFILSSALIPD